jgi:hypothetical protein
MTDCAQRKNVRYDGLLGVVAICRRKEQQAEVDHPHGEDPSQGR